MATTVQIDSQPAERAALVAGLRQLADWFEQHTEVPVPAYQDFTFSARQSGVDWATDDAEGLARLDVIAAALGVGIDYGQHIVAERMFAGLRVRAVFIPEAARNASMAPAAAVVVPEGGDEDALTPDAAGAGAEESPAPAWRGEWRRVLDAVAQEVVHRTPTGRAVLWPMRTANAATDAVVAELIALGLVAEPPEGASFYTLTDAGAEARRAIVPAEAASTMDYRESKVWACPEGCGYHIADGPVPEGEDPTDELIRQHLDEHVHDDRAVCRWCAARIEQILPGGCGWYDQNRWWSCNVRPGGITLGHEPITPDAPAVVPSAVSR